MRLVFVPDSTRQQTLDGGATPALLMFNDEIHHVVRDYQEMAEDLRVVVVSHKYGLIGGQAKIVPYSKRISFEDVDRLLPAFQKQWSSNEAAWFADVTDVCIALTGPLLYILQRLEVMVNIPRRPEIRSFVVANVAPAAQMLRWLEAGERVDDVP